MLLKVAKRKTEQADIKLDDQGRVIKRTEEDEYGDNVLIVKHEEIETPSASAETPATGAKKAKEKRTGKAGR